MMEKNTERNAPQQRSETSRFAQARRFFAGLVLAERRRPSPWPEPRGPRYAGHHHAADGHSLFLVAPAVGAQGYICLPTSAGAATASWTVKSSRPEATLFQRVFGYDVQIATHFLSPDANPNDAAPNPLPFGSATWQSSLDTSRVWAQVLHANSIPAGSDPTCPNAGSIPCPLLQSIGSQAGTSGGTTLSKTSFIQRLNTRGGVAPADGCATSADVGSQTLVPYTADYYLLPKKQLVTGAVPPRPPPRGGHGNSGRRRGLL